VFVVIGHVAPRGPEYKQIVRAIRRQHPDTPIQLFSGHSHIRDFVKFDDKAYALQSGRYFETVGWMAIDGLAPTRTIDGVARGMPPLRFERRYIDNNLFGYYHHTGLNASTFPTEQGKNVTRFIADARNEMDLDHTFGCAPRDYWTNRAPFPHVDSVYSLMTDEVLPSILVPADRADVPRLAITNTGGLRFDIFKGRFTRDTTLIVCPFDNQFNYIRDVPFSVAKKVLPLLNAGGQVFAAAAEEEGLQSWRLAPPMQMSMPDDIPWEDYNSLAAMRASMDRNKAQHAVGGESEAPKLVPGYTTRDDAGHAGDDTVHSPITFYRVPNCIQAEISFPQQGDPETVDLVFLDFVEPWILLALRYVGGGQYGKDDVESYMDGRSFTRMWEEWVEENWKGQC
jgi:hypothetical protein